MGPILKEVLHDILTEIKQLKSRPDYMDIIAREYQLPLNQISQFLPYTEWNSEETGFIFRDKIESELRRLGLL